jgi:hypothetical protein
LKFKYFLLKPKNIIQQVNFFKKNEQVYYFKKFFVKSRKKLTKVNFNSKNENITFLHKFFCISMKSGNKSTLFKHFELFFKNYLNVMFYNDEKNNKNEFFVNFVYYDIIKILIKKKNFFFNFNKLLSLVLPAYDSLFSIKIKKLNKKLRLKYKRKYINNIVYVPAKNRVNLTLKFINIQSFIAKNFKLSERYFKVFLMLILSPYRTLP